MAPNVLVHIRDLVHFAFAELLWIGLLFLSGCRHWSRLCTLLSSRRHRLLRRRFLSGHGGALGILLLLPLVLLLLLLFLLALWRWLLVLANKRIQVFQD